MLKTHKKTFQSGIYMVILQGQNGSRIFLDESERQSFLWCLSDIQKKSSFDLCCSYVAWSNICLIVKEGNESLAQILRKLGSRYGYRFGKPECRIALLESLPDSSFQRFSTDAEWHRVMTDINNKARINEQDAECKYFYDAASRNIGRRLKASLLLLPILISLISGCSKPKQAEDPSDPPANTASAEPTIEVVIPTIEPTIEETPIIVTTPEIENTPEIEVTPSEEPTIDITVEPTTEVTVIPTRTPTVEPSVVPTAKPSNTPVSTPTSKPTSVPTAVPTPVATATPNYNQTPTIIEATGVTEVKYEEFFLFKGFSKQAIKQDGLDPENCEYVIPTGCTYYDYDITITNYDPGELKYMLIDTRNSIIHWIEDWEVEERQASGKWILFDISEYSLEPGAHHWHETYVKNIPIGFELEEKLLLFYEEQHNKDSETGKEVIWNSLKKIIAIAWNKIPIQKTEFKRDIIDSNGKVIDTVKLHEFSQKEKTYTFSITD